MYNSQPTEYQSIQYQSHDGLNLYARDYPASSDAPVLLCLHGLTRNSADFEGFCEHFSGRYRLIIPDQRGRGRSDYDSNSDNYQLPVYTQDMLTLLDHLRLDRVTLVGTSMGGLISMAIAATTPEKVNAIVLNDIGPEIDPAGLLRIQHYVGKSPAFDRWEQVAAEVERNNGDAFPDFDKKDWLAFALRTYQERGDNIVPSYDPAISEPMDRGDAIPDLWPLFSMLSDIPTLVVRGESSDILSANTVARMAQRHGKLSATTIANRGHAPLLDEPDAVTVINGFLQHQLQAVC